jgi:hypothetical protein
MWREDSSDKTPEEIRREAVEAEVWQWLPDYSGNDAEARQKALTSEYARAIEAVSRAALAYSELSGEKLQNLLAIGMRLVRSLQFATNPQFEERGEEALTFWSHRHDPLIDVLSKQTPVLNRWELEPLVGEYLELPYRCTTLDRTLVDVLLALETYQYADEMLNEDVTLFVDPPRSPLKRTHPLVGWLMSLGICALLLIALCAAVYGLHRLNVLSDDWAAGAYALFGVLFLLAMGWTTVMTPLLWVKHSRSVRKVRQLMGLMAGTYRELETYGPVSVAHLRQRMAAGDAEGIRWPGPLYALLDDIASRSGRL